MGGINTLSGLNNVSVDFRPTVELIQPKTENTAPLMPEGDVAPQNAPQPPKAEARSVVQKLDVLLLNEAIEYAKKLNEQGKVYGTEQWQDKTNLFTMTNVVSDVEIEKSDGTTITVDPKLKYVSDFRTRDCPSLYKRDDFHDKMFFTFAEL